MTAAAQEASGAGLGGGAPAGGLGTATGAATGTGSGGGAATGFSSAPAQTLASPSVLPATGFATGDTGGASAVRLGDLGTRVAQSFGLPAPAAAGPAPPEWQITPSVGVTEELTDNGSTGPSGRARGDLITTLQPGIALTGDTPRLQVNLAYSPQVYLYARDGSQNRVAHDLNGRVLATLLPQTLFLDVRGLATEQSVSGGVGPDSTDILSRDQTAQDFSFSASPYLIHRFGSLGSGEVGYSIARTIETANGTVAATPGTLGVPFGLPFGALPGQPLLTSPNQRTTTQNVHAAFVTGENFGRYNGTALASATHYDGTGVLSGAHRDIFTIDNGYAVTRTIVLLGTLGYEDILYSGTTPLRITDAIWDFGLRVTPNADSTLVVRYGHHDGLDALTVDGSLAPSPRTRVYVRYSTGLTTSQEELQNALATTDLDSLGNPVDHGTGAPIFAASNFFGLQDNLTKLRRLSISAAYLLDRDTFTADVENDTSTVLSQSGVGANAGLGSNSGTYGSLAWQHALSPQMSSNLYVQYGVRTLDGPPSVSQNLLVTSAALSYALGPGLDSSLEYSHEQVEGGGVPSFSDNILLLSVIKTF